MSPLSTSGMRRCSTSSTCLTVYSNEDPSGVLMRMNRNPRSSCGAYSLGTARNNTALPAKLISSTTPVNQDVP